MPAAPANVDALLADIESLQSAQEKTVKSLEKAGKPADPDARRTFSARKGESSMTSRPFSFLKAMGVLAGHVDRDDAKVECEVAASLKRYYDGYGFKKALTNSIWLPICGDFLVGDAQLQKYVGDVVRAGNPQNDPDEVAWLRRKMAMGGYTKALSWIDETIGGALVAPPAFGELIDVLRNNVALMVAGARTMPMPPQGRIIFPRQTTAMSAFHVGESSTATESTPGTGDVVLQAKKLTILAKIPNELFHFSAIPIEAFIREDMGKVVSLKMDKTLLEDPGSSTVPKGLINYSGITSYTSIGSPADANSGYPFQPEDPTNMVANVEEKNAEFKAFIMRPLLWATLVNRRSDAVTAGDKKGPFLFNIVRDQGMGLGLDRLKTGVLNGYPVVKTTQLSTAHTRGTGSTQNTYVIGGDFQDYLIAMSGAMEFQVSTQGDTPFTTDQTWLKGVCYYDGAPRHEASFVLADNILQNS